MAENSGEEESETTSFDRDAFVEWASDRRRMVLLDCLREFDEPVTLPDLADEIAVREADEEITEIPGEEVKEVYLSLYHSHIPELAEAGVVEYDQVADLVSFAPDIDPDQLPGAGADE